MSDFKASVIMETVQPLFDRKAADPLMREIAKTIANDARKNIRTQMDPDDRPFAPLKPETIERKIKKRALYPDKALIDKQIMLNSVHVFKKKLSHYDVGVRAIGKPKRDLVAFIHHEEARTTRQFLGISAKRMQWIDERIERWVDSQLRQAKRILRTKVF